MMRTELYLCIRTKELLCKLRKCTLKVSKSGLLIYYHSLYLMKYR